MSRLRHWLTISLIAAAINGRAQTQPVAPIVGVNLANPQHLNVEKQDALLHDLKAASVHYIRMPLADENAIVLARRAFAQGIKVDFIVPLQYRPNAPLRAEMAGQYAARRLSDASPEAFKKVFGRQLQELDSAGVVLAGLELGNEINLTGFNGDFPVPGHGQVFSLQDLRSDPEGQMVAAGYRAYVTVLAVLKDIRDHSTLNRNTPIISAGLSPAGPPGVRRGSQIDAVSIGATLQFLKDLGIDEHVDRYGIHVYPDPKVSSNERWARMNEDTFSECGNGSQGKSCWVTEWGFVYQNDTCPADDRTRLELYSSILGMFKEFVHQGRLNGMFYFAWAPDPWAVKATAKWSIFRCGGLTEAGRLALAPRLQ